MNAADGKGQRVLELASVTLFMLLAAWSLWRVLAATQLHFPAVALVAVPAGWLAADLLSGLTHWALDSFGSARTPIIGHGFIRPFRAHHAEPEAMTRHDFVETHGASCLASLPFLAAASVMPVDTWLEILTQAVLLSTALGALATNQCHKWVQMDEASTPKQVRWGCDLDLMFGFSGVLASRTDRASPKIVATDLGSASTNVDSIQSPHPCLSSASPIGTSAV